VSNAARVQTPSLLSRAVAGLLLFALPVACNSPTPTQPSPSLTQPVPNLPGPSRTGLSGTYSLTLSASSACRLELPEDLRTFTYPATIIQGDDSLTVTVHHNRFPGWDNRFTGVVGETNHVIFQLRFEDWWVYRAELGEWAEFHASGTITSTISADGLSGLLDGDMTAIVVNEGGRGSRSITCTAPDHGVVFSRSPQP
jgi:hypothetical protein